MSDFYSLISKRYELLKELGRGGMGVVYLATQRDLNRLVALKVVPQTYLANPTSRDRFRREIQIMRKLNHPGVVGIYEVDELPDGSSVIVMEYMKGRSLEDIRLDGPTKDWKKVAEWGAKAADALHHAHQQGVVHRDVKPGNIMLLEDGRIKVMDFGIAKAEGGQNLTMDRIIGTPAYMSPEQALGKPVDHRADIYSLGVTLYAMLAGHSPFDRDGNSHSLEVIQRQINDAAEFLGTRVEGLPEPLVTLIHQMISKSPLDRPVDAEDVRKKLENLLTKKVRKEFFLTTLMNEIGTIGDRLKRDRLKPTDFVMMELVLPGLSKILTHQMMLGLFVAVFSCSAFFTPFPISISIIFRLIAAVLTFFSLKGADTKATLNYLWFYQRIPFMLFSLLVVGGTAGALVYEFNKKYGREEEIPELVNATQKADGVDTGLGTTPTKQDTTQPAQPEDTNYGLGKVEPTATPEPTPEPTVAVATPEPTAAVEVAKAATPTPMPTPRPSPTKRAPSALDLIEREVVQAKTPTPVITPMVSTIKPAAELAGGELVDEASLAIKKRDTERIEEILTVLNKKQDIQNPELVTRFFLTSALDWLDQRGYMKHVKEENWVIYDDDFASLKAKVAGDKDEKTQYALLNLMLNQSFNLSMTVTRRRGLVDFIDPAYGQPLVDKALESDDRDRQYAAMLAMRDRAKPEFTKVVMNIFGTRFDNKAMADAFQEECLAWIEKYASSDAIPQLEERQKRNDVMLDEKRRLQEAVARIQKRGGG
ncbi:serine/threonine protein kinase [Candidatus Sumerlaeota bacterium]|nr:serine/threonine protein kinase [Candidatus Sumerlaeota bacterium]